MAGSWRCSGYSRQLIPANWKLMFENIKDPYHASLLHVFLVTFGLFRADNPSQVQVDKTGRHGALISWRGEQQTHGRQRRDQIAARALHACTIRVCCSRCASSPSTPW